MERLCAFGADSRYESASSYQVVGVDLRYQWPAVIKWLIGPTEDISSYRKVKWFIEPTEKVNGYRLVKCFHGGQLMMLLGYKKRGIFFSSTSVSSWRRSNNMKSYKPEVKLMKIGCHMFGRS